MITFPTKRPSLKIMDSIGEPCMGQGSNEKLIKRIDLRAGGLGDLKLGKLMERFYTIKLHSYCFDHAELNSSD